MFALYVPDTCNYYYNTHKEFATFRDKRKEGVRQTVLKT